ncbi:hypothetical protein M1432_02980 [Patescibacteria group bacterium]|nr:hypothetical protein [Patescibacteria group bacterium]
MEESTKKKYELTFWLPTEDAGAVKGLLAKHGVEVLAERPVSKFSLSYPIKKATSAFLHSYACAIEPEKTGDLVADIEAVPGVLRSLLSVVVERADRPAGAIGEIGIGAGRGRGIFGRRARTESPAVGEVLTNEALEKKIEEISK